MPNSFPRGPHVDLLAFAAPANPYVYQDAPSTHLQSASPCVHCAGMEPMSTSYPFLFDAATIQQPVPASQWSYVTPPQGVPGAAGLSSQTSGTVGGVIPSDVGRASLTLSPELNWL